MKKVLFILSLILLASCSKDDDVTITSSVNVAVYYHANGSDSHRATTCFAGLFNCAYSDVSTEYTDVLHIASARNLKLKNGSTLEPVYNSISFNGSCDFTDVAHGKYLLVVCYKPDGYSFENFYYYGCQEVNITAKEYQSFKFDFELGQNGKLINQ